MRQDLAGAPLAQSLHADTWSCYPVLLEALAEDAVPGKPHSTSVVIWPFTSFSSQGSSSIFPELVSYAVAPAECLSVLIPHLCSPVLEVLAEPFLVL